MKHGNAKSLTAFYLNYFGDQCGRVSEWIPTNITAKEDEMTHVELWQAPYRVPDFNLEDGSVITVDMVDEMVALDMLTHPCHCEPELIYADDLRGNEVWLHKRPQ